MRPPRRSRESTTLSVQDVRDEVVCRRRLEAWEDRDPQRGLRIYVNVTIRRRDVLVVLKRHRYQIDEYVLISAHVV